MTHTLVTQVLIVGGGPVGLTLAALLTKQGVSTLVVEARSGYCTGSRAICMSRRSAQILSWIGADQAFVDKGLPWTGGRSYWRGADPKHEVLHFQMPHDAKERFAPMTNIQQFYVEQFAHEAINTNCGQVLWQHQLKRLEQNAAGVMAAVDDLGKGVQLNIQAQYLVACDGGKSTVRDLCGLRLEGMQYEGRYVIVDIEQDTQRPTERLAWFDPPSNPGSTILMHRQPDNVWRIDYQIRDDENAEEAVKPQNVLPRVQSHLQMIGEYAPWKLLWTSIYNAKCLTLPAYQYPQDFGRVFFAGDAAHLVPIFGVRGLNSGLDDAANLAWKLASVIQGKAAGDAAQKLLHSYSTERVAAARENMAYGAKSTEFMAPPHRGFALMRDAALRLASVGSPVKSLINPRQTTPVAYVDSWLNFDNTSAASPYAKRLVGLPAPEALLAGRSGQGWLELSLGTDRGVILVRPDGYVAGACDAKTYFAAKGFKP